MIQFKTLIWTAAVLFALFVASWAVDAFSAATAGLDQKPKNADIEIIEN